MDLKVLLGLFLMCATMVWGDEVGEKKLDFQPTAGDDSDMYMEPLEDDHQASSSDVQEQSETGHWFPSFSRSYDPFDHPTSGHSRPVFYNYPQQEGAYSQRNDPPFQQDLKYKDQPKYNGYNTYNNKDYQQGSSQQQQQATADKSAALLGDGNFGVIQGGTFYPEKDGYDSDSSGFDDFSSYFYNGHGRPSYSYSSNPKPGKQQQFENFRDFADINSPPERQYSQYVVVYTNKNGTRTSRTTTIDQPEPENVQIDAKRPKNILESLALLDNTEPSKDETKNDPPQDNIMILTRTLLLPSYDQGDIIEIPPEKKGSKSKRKLAKLVPEKKHEARLMQKAKDMKEPLLALS